MDKNNIMKHALFYTHIKCYASFGIFIGSIIGFIVGIFMG